MQHLESSEVRYLTQVIALLRKTFFPSLISAGPKLNAFERLHRKHCIMDRNGNGLNETVMNPTNLSDSSKSKEETVEVGVIVMGLCCICLVACALAVLHLRSSSRRISGNRRRAEHSGGVSEDRSRDPLDVAAPPSYDTVIRSPHLYPPSRQISMSPGVSETRRSSGSSTFSLSLHSPRLTHHYLEAPRETPEENLSEHPSLQMFHQEDNEEPPPPYPGNIISRETGQDASLTVNVCQGNSRTFSESTGQGERNQRTVENELNSWNSEARESTSHVVNAWTSCEALHQSPNGDIRNELCRQPKVFRTVVSYSSQLQRGKEAVSESLAFSDEDANTV